MYLRCIIRDPYRSPALVVTAAAAVFVVVPFLSLRRFVYVDEYTCIGCTHCNHEAPSTFFMEEDYGRARVYQQGRDTDEAVS